MLAEDIIKRRGKTIPVKTPLSIKIKKSIVGLCFALLAVIIMFGIVYLLNSSQSNQKGYIVTKQQLEQDQLKSANRDLTSKINDAKATYTVEKNPLLKEFIKPEQIIYVEDRKQ